MAKQKIVPGDVLIVDEPYISTLFRAHQPTHCYHCFRRLPSEPGDCVPSPHCDKVQLHNPHIALGAVQLYAEMVMGSIKIMALRR